MLALQTASAALASMLAPAKILVGLSTVSRGAGAGAGTPAGAEGQILRQLLKYGGALLLAIIALAALFGGLR